MSVINKKPFINTVLESLSVSDKATLKSLIDGSGAESVFRSILPYGSPLLSESDKGIKRVELEVSSLSAQKVYEGYLIYNDDYCVLIAYYGVKNQGLKLIDLVLGEDGLWSYELKPCQLGIVELRSELDDAAEAAGELDAEGAEWVNANKNKVLTQVFEVSNITSISKTILDSLQPGDIVRKITGNEKHTYEVSYKGTGAGTGICLTYTAAGYIETVSYDRDGSDWVYNSTDVVSGLEDALKMPSGLDPAKTYTLKIVGGVLSAVEDE